MSRVKWDGDGLERRAMSAHWRDIDDYLANLPDKDRSVLERLRMTIRAAAPKATETISYGMPTFKYLGLLVGFAAFKHHCSFFPMSASLMEEYKSQLKSYDTSKGTIRFLANKPIPATLVRRMVKARIRQNEAKARKRDERAKRRRS